MKKKTIDNLSRRERQIMDIIYQKEKATAAEIKDLMPDPPSYSSVRALLRVLEDKGFLRHKEQGPRYIFYPTINREKAKTSALKHVMKTFFDNSTERLVAALLDMSDSNLSDEELDKMAQLIDEARKEEL